MSGAGGDDDLDHVRLTGYGKRDAFDGPKGESIWHQSPLFKNGVYEPGSTSEREQFLPPVKLDPGWDGMANNAVIRRSSTQQLISEMQKNPPRDRMRMVYIIMMIHGIAILIPWNMFINAKAYFENYKLDQGNQSSAALLDYKTNFMSYVGMASQWPNFLMNLINLCCQCGGGRLGPKIVVSIFIMIVMFVFTVVLAMIDSSDWPETFFWITMATAVVINAAVGMYQNSMYGLVAVLPMKYTNAVILGNRFFRHHLELSQLKKKELKEKLVHQEPLIKVLMKSFGRVIKEIWHLAFGVFFTFFITLALFPAVVSDVKPLQVKMHDDYWIAVFCFLFFNFFATVGNFATEFVKWPNSRWVNVLVILRVLFIPLMVLGNFRPDLRTLPVYFNHDAIFIASVILFAFSSGYCSSLLMMYAPKCVNLNDSPIAGMIMALFLVFGILSGINCSRLWGYIIKLG
ncbi:equilibrative nucleoside transporter [Elysia marginata]|uniref:Equilibrative nucleoside transporter n=1 Tax=Elysia marginata TaxID=1093978 RepID=A0AAV4G8Z2_9GAST|nr:equilibrative nucleoside transporter [Elysia marginata]